MRTRGPNPDLESFTLIEEFHTDHQYLPFQAKRLPIHGNIMFIWPCIMNWLYINYQLDALIINYS